MFWRVQRFYSTNPKKSVADAVFGIPAAAGSEGKVPPLFCLAADLFGRNFMIKAGCPTYCCGAGLMLIAPDTSHVAPISRRSRQLGFRVGARFLSRSTEAPWDKHYRMVQLRAGAI